MLGLAPLYKRFDLYYLLLSLYIISLVEVQVVSQTLKWLHDVVHWMFLTF